MKWLFLWPQIDFVSFASYWQKRYFYFPYEFGIHFYFHDINSTQYYPMIFTFICMSVAAILHWPQTPPEYFKFLQTDVSVPSNFLKWSTICMCYPPINHIKKNKNKKTAKQILVRLFPQFLFVCLKFLENLKFFMKKNQYLDRLPQGKSTSTDKQLEKEVSAVLKGVTPTRVMRQAWMSQGALLGTGCDSEVLFKWGTSFSSWKTF